jgi:hypothetical protein
MILIDKQPDDLADLQGRYPSRAPEGHKNPASRRTHLPISQAIRDPEPPLTSPLAGLDILRIAVPLAWPL